MKDFIKKYEGQVFRYWIRKEIWTPYEMHIKDPIQCDTYSEECDYGYFTDCFDLGNGDWLIEVTNTEWDCPNYTSKHYYRLSVMDIQFISTDQENGGDSDNEN